MQSLRYQRNLTKGLRKMASTFKCFYCEALHQDRYGAVTCCATTEEVSAFKCAHCGAIHEEEGEAQECCAPTLEIHNIEDYKQILMSIWNQKNTNNFMDEFKVLPPSFFTNIAENQFTFTLPFQIDEQVFKAWCHCNQISFAHVVDLLEANTQRGYDLKFSFHPNNCSDKVLIQIRAIADLLSGDIVYCLSCQLLAQEKFMLKIKDTTYSNMNTNIDLLVFDLDISDDVQLNKVIKLILNSEACYIQFDFISGDIYVFDKNKCVLLHINHSLEILLLKLDPRYNIEIAR